MNNNISIYSRTYFAPFEILINFLFLALVFFLPFTKIGIPALGKYEMTLGDMLMFTLAGIYILMNKKINLKYSSYLLVLILFTVLVHLNIIVAIDHYKFLLSSIPHFFALTLVYVTICYFTTNHFIPKIRALRNTLIISLLLSSLPVYIQLITGFKNVLFYDEWGWRYSFLAQNPNQYGVYFILFLILITLITIKYFKNELPKIFFFELIFIMPALFSGSKTATLLYFLNIGIMLFSVFYFTTVVRRVTYSIIAGIISVIMLPFLFNFVFSMTGQVGRALRIFEKLSSNKRFDIGGQTGTSMDEGWQLFHNNPILGVGLGNKTAYVGIHEIHNTYLKYLTESGIVGFIGLVMIFLFPIVLLLTSKVEKVFKFIALSFYTLFALMNVPHMLFRQRWVWLFISILVVISYWDKNGNPSKSSLKFLN